MDQIAKFFGASEAEFVELCEIYPNLRQQTLAELKDTIFVLCEFGLSPLDAKSLIWVVPRIFTLPREELRALLNKKLRFCQLYDIDFVEKIYAEPNFLVDD